MYLLILLFPMSLLITFIATNHPSLVESFYSRGFYIIINKLLYIPSHLISFSLGEILLYFTFSFFIYFAISFIYKNLYKKLFKKANFFKIKTTLLRGLLKIILFLSILYFIFIMNWGLNYHRLPFSNIANLEIKSSSIEVLQSLCKDLIWRSNALRKHMREDPNGVTYIPNGFKNVAQRSQLAYHHISKKYPVLDLKTSNPKGVIFSKGMSYAGIAGIYCPFTGEANVNTMIPHAMLPNTTTHEMAHQRGFAREDEANYIAYLACTSHPDYDFQYSGVLLALIHSMNELYKYDIESYNQLAQEYSDGVQRDLTAINTFWDFYRGPIERTSIKMNNAYLKSNFQEDGIKSYGRMVDLLIAEYRLMQNN